MKIGGRWAQKWKVAYIRRAARLRAQLTNKALARRLGVSMDTVRYHSKKVYRKRCE